MKLISAKEIEDYTIKNPRDAQGSIPELLRKLIKDTVSKANLIKCDIPSEDNIIISGLDGDIIIDENNLYIGEGEICIEIGTDKDFLNKAKEDIKKRNETEENKQNKTFVFVTSRIWNSPKMNKNKWVENNKGKWKDLRIIDAVSLENWIEESVPTAKWFSDKIGKNIDNIMNINDINNELINQTKDKFDLSFFDYEDKEFRDEFEQSINLEKEVVRVKGETIEEVFYYILFILSQNDEQKDKVIIVENYEQWGKLLKAKIKNCILIPKFKQEGLEVIINNINVFLFFEDDYIREEAIELKERLRDNLTRKLKEKLDINKVDVILENSFVKFSPLKRIIFKNDYIPNWSKIEDKSIFIPILLFRKFHESDEQAIKQMTGKNLDDYINQIKNYLNSNDPFAIHIKENEIYTLINRYEAWDILYKEITTDELLVFKTIAKEILTYQDPKYELDDDKIVFAAAYQREKPKYSEILKLSIVDTIILFKQYYKKNEHRDSNFFDDIVKAYYDSIDNEKKWMNFSKIANELVEYSPELYLKKINDSIDNPEFKKIFRVTQGSLFSPNYYSQILWGLEKLLYIEEYVAETIHTIARIAEFNVNYKNNKPMNTLRTAFVAWDNIINISLEEKVNLLSEIVTKYKIGHKLLLSVLPEYHSSWMHFTKPKHLTFELKYPIKYKKEQMDTFSKYYEIYLTNYSQDLNKMSDLYETISFLKMDIGPKISETVIHLITKADDTSKYELEKKVRKLLYGFYNYDNEIWKLLDSEKAHLESIMETIKYNNLIYKYLYLFAEWTPNIIFKAADGNEDKEIDNLREQAIIDLKKNDVDIVKLCIAIPDSGPTIAGKCIYKLYHDNIHNINFINELFLNKKIGILREYISSISKKEGTKIIIDIFKSKEINEIKMKDKILILIWAELTNELIDFINEDEEISKLYWSQIQIRFFPEDLFVKVYENLLKHENYNECLQLIFNRDLKIEIKVDLLEKISSSSMSCHQMDEYYINEIFKAIYSCSYEDKERISKLEIYFMNIMDEENKLKYFESEIFENPEILTEIINIAYNDDDNKEKILSEKEKIAAQNCYLIIQTISKIKLNEKNMKKWVDKYFSLLEQNNQKNIGTHILGLLLAKSELDKIDFIYPCKINRQIIEEYYSEELSNAFKMQAHNNRGVYSSNHGEGEKQLAIQYKEWAEKTKVNYKKTSKILREISEEYNAESIRARKESNYGY